MRLVACQLDPRARHLDTEVVACEPTAHGARVRLADTVLYPEGGGQPADRGHIGEIEVLDVQWEGDEVVHVTAAPVPTGPARVTVDWTRRFDHMQQHTAQHLITAVALARLEAATVGFHLGPTESTVDLDREVDDAALRSLEDAVNQAILDDHPVRMHVVDRAGMEALGARSRRIKAGWDGPIRLIEIDGLDLNTCGGTHVARLGELGAVSLVDAARHKGGTRVTFLAGARVRAALQQGLARQRALSALLTCHPDDHAAAVAKLLDDVKAGVRDARALRRELAGALAAGLGPVDPVLIRRPEADPAWLSELAAAALAARPDATVLVVGGPAQGDGVFLLVGPKDRVKAAGPRVAAALDGRGGGPPGRYQGKAAAVERAEDALETLTGS